ncbi:hypothetical protein UVI_02052220 [Ustilaginoidea virens]|nr:hypothetical protein UVI_02052220 [Ustilaginoidea virens]
MEMVCERLGLDLPQPLESAHSNLSTNTAIQDGESDDGEEGLYEPAQIDAPTTVVAPIDAYLSKQESPSSGQGQAVAAVSLQHRKPDLISKGLVTFGDADVLAKHYIVELDHIVYGFVRDHKTIHSLRDASAALIAVICTVASLHHVDYGHLFETCYREYRHVISSTLFEKQDVEHIRALCIGSFWLPGSSRILLCDAVRRAGDLRLHRHILKTINLTASCSLSPRTGITTDQAESRDRVRLWYGLFMCDQHQSILSNRESLLPLHLDVLEKREEYLKSDASINHDLRLVAQSSLLLIMARIKREFGSEYTAQVPESIAPEFLKFSAELDEWIEKYRPRFHPDIEMGKYPSLAFRLHYLFAKLYLGHKVFRGLQGNAFANTFLAAASLAHESAEGIFHMILEEDGLLKNLWKVPSYVHIMISFAGHLLLELCVKYRKPLGIDVKENYRILNDVVSAMRDIRLTCSHPLARVIMGLQKRLFDFTALYGRENLSEVAEPDLQEKNVGFTGGLPQNAPICDDVVTDMVNESLFTGLGDFTTFQDFGVGNAGLWSV